jgi:hypothetical protein
MGLGTAGWLEATGLVVALSVAMGSFGCDHPWDDYEYRPAAGGAAPGGGGAGGQATGGTGGAPEECENICEAWQTCAGSSWLSCVGECSTCTSEELITIGYCAASFTQNCPAAVVGFNSCVSSVACIEPPPI